MRITVAAAVVSLSIVGLSLAEDVHGAMRRTTDISEQSLGEALQSLARDRDLQLIYSYDVVGDLRTRGAHGDLSANEALNQLLAGTGLAYHYLDDNTVTIAPAGGTSVAPQNHLWEQFRLAQANQGLPAGPVAVAANSSSSGDGSLQLEEIVVTAQKRAERQQDVPLAMTVLDPQKLAESGQNRLVDYFSSVPGLNLSSNAYFGGTNYLTIRGLSTGFNQNPTVTTVIDDVPVVSSLEVSDGMYTSPDLDPSDLARIEVLKGPQGTLYGASSLGGLVKYVTVDPSTDALSGRVEMGGVDVPDGGLGYTVRGSVNIPVSSELAVRFSGFDRRDPGYIDDLTTHQSNFNYADVYGGHIAALLRPSENLSLKLSALIQKNDGNASLINSDSLEQFPQGDLHATGMPGTFNYSTENQLYSATLDAKVAGLEIVAVTGYTVNGFRNWADATTNYFGSLAGQEFPGSTGSSTFQEFTTHKVSQELRVSSSIGSWLDWRAAGFYTHESSPNANVFTVYAANAATGATTGDEYTATGTTLTFSEYAVFGDLTAHLTDRFDLELGGRESWNRQSYQLLITGAATKLFTGFDPPYAQPLQGASGNAFTYLVTPKLKLSRDLMVYARVASGYRIGGANDAAYSVAAAAAGIPKSYTPDRTINYELGFKGDLLDHRLSFDAAAYYIDWSDFQTSVTETIGNGAGALNYTFTTNAGHAKSEGVELSLQARPSRGLTLTAEGSYDDAVLTQALPAGANVYGLKGDRLPYSMRFSGGLSANQDVAFSQRWTGFFGGSVNYVGLRPYEFTTCCTSTGQPNRRFEFPAYTQLNLRSGARFDSWQINLYLNNVTDKRGIVGLNTNSAIGSTGGYYLSVIQPRTIGLSVARSF